MSKVTNDEDIDIIMAEMEGKTRPPRPSERSKTVEKFSDIVKRPAEEEDRQPVSDDVDAKGISDSDAMGYGINRVITSIFSSKPVQPGKTYPSKPTDERYYDFTHEKVGYALIFNQIHVKGERARAGSGKDATDLAEVLSDIGFDVEICPDYDVNTIEKKLLAVSKLDHRDNDCLLITIMTHGKQDGKIYAKDREFNVQDLWEFFIGNKCPSLIGKPKLFFIQACRGNMTDPGIIYKPKPKVRLLSQSDTVDAKPKEDIFVIPTLADLLVMYSTAEGFYSFRNPEDGSWFIQAICNELRENPHEDLMTILTGVNRRVAFGKQSFVPDNNDWDAMKQMPNIVSMLTKTMYFMKKPMKLALESA